MPNFLVTKQIVLALYQLKERSKRSKSVQYGKYAACHEPVVSLDTKLTVQTY